MNEEVKIKRKENASKRLTGVVELVVEDLQEVAAWLQECLRASKGSCSQYVSW
jgi:hypothetical protein